jgi:hypothetical protein
MQNIMTIRNTHNKETNHQSNKIIETQIGILFCSLLICDIWNH